MLKIINSNFINRSVCLLLASIFLSIFPAGNAALSFCLDEQESHIVSQNFYLVDCHSYDEVGGIFSDEYFSIVAERRGNNCTDVSLTNANILNRPSKIRLPIASKVIQFYKLPNGLIRIQQKVAGYKSIVLYQPLFISPGINDHKTMVLLI